MSIKLKPLDQQVILITGASSGIGLITAQTAASMGAKVILIARNEEALDTAAADIINAGGEAIAIVADVGDEAAFRAAAQKGFERFGRIDTWVNNAGAGMYGKVTETDLADDRKLFETNFWGVVHGSRLAVEYLRDSGGAIINVGSVVSDVTMPPQGMYAATKHAVLGFTDALRIEIQRDQLPISVTLIKPAAIDTPFPDHARNYFDKEASLPPPVYEPSIVASAILFTATHPRRELHAGGGGRLMSMMARELPKVMDFLAGSSLFYNKNFAPRPTCDHEGALHQTKKSGSVHGSASQDRMVKKFSAYNTAVQHPIVTSGTIATAAIGAVALYLLLDHQRKPASWRDRIGEYGEELADRVTDGVSHVTGGWTRGLAGAAKFANQVHRHADRFSDRVSDRIAEGASTLGDRASHLVGAASSWWR